MAQCRHASNRCCVWLCLLTPSVLALSQFLSQCTKYPSENQKLRQNLSVNVCRLRFLIFPSAPAVRPSVVLAVGSRPQRLQTASFVPHFAICSHLPDACSRLFFPHNPLLLAGFKQRRKQNSCILPPSLSGSTFNQL